LKKKESEWADSPFFHLKLVMGFLISNKNYSCSGGGEDIFGIIREQSTVLCATA